jgi:hypothetical protein
MAAGHGDGAMSEIEDDLRTTSDTILRETDKLVGLEKEKRKPDLSDTERVRLSDEVVKLARRLEIATLAESDLAREAAAEG